MAVKTFRNLLLAGTLAGVCATGYTSKGLIDDLLEIDMKYDVYQRHREVFSYNSKISTYEIEKMRNDEIYSKINEKAPGVLASGLVSLAFGIALLPNLKRK